MLALALALTLTQTPQHRLFMEPNLPRGGGSAILLSLASSSAGCVSASSLPVSGATATFARASAAWAWSDDQQTWTQCSSGQARIAAATTNGRRVYIAEPDGTNQVFYPSDLTQVSKWTATSATVTRITGPTGVANSASRICATAANATVVQTGIAGVQGTSIGSVFLRRNTGSGAVTLSLNNFTGNVSVGSRIDATWKRAVGRETHGCAGGNCIIDPGMTIFTATPYVWGFKLATSGDCIDVWATQVEVPTSSDVTAQPLAPTSPIDDNSGVRGTRNADQLYLTPASSFVPASVSARVQYTGQANTFMDLTDGTNFVRVTGANGGTPDQRLNCTRTNTTTTTGGGYTPMPLAGALSHVGCELVSGGLITAFLRAFPDTTTGTGAEATPTINKIQVGGRFSTTANNMAGGIGDICVSPTPGRCLWSDFDQTENPTVWVGDSILYGNGGSSGAGTRPPGTFETIVSVNLTPSIAKPSYNYAVGSTVTSTHLATWRNYVASAGFRTLVLQGGTNDVAAGIDAGYIVSNLTTIANDAVSRGMRVIYVNITPRGYGAGTSSQNALLMVNSQMQTYAASAGVAYIDAYTFFLGTGTSLSATYDFGDGLHLNALGSATLANLVYDAGVP